MAVDIINPNYNMGTWLQALLHRGVISRDALNNAYLHFGLKHNAEAWHVFIKRFFALLGTLLATAGLIFFMAWNWESMSRFAKFAVVEIVFILFAGYSIIRWPRSEADGWRWDARTALAGSALTIGGLLALYGQIYQTGADPWELFRTWTIMLLVLAFPGKATVFWFMAWLTGSIWFILYYEENNFLFWYYGTSILSMTALFQFAILAVYEVTRYFITRGGYFFDPQHWLGRFIGSTAIIFMGVYAATSIALTPYWQAETANIWPILLYFISLVVCFAVYYFIIPELLLLFLSIASLATFIPTKVISSLLYSWNPELGTLIFIGIFILCIVFASLKLFLILRKNIQHRALHSNSKAKDLAHSFGLFRNRENKKQELKHWLLAQGAAKEDQLDAYFTTDEVEHEQDSPWYVKFFVTIGVWLGSALFLGAFTALIFDDTISALGIVGIIFCFLSIQFGQEAKLHIRALSQIIGVFGLIYAAFLFDFNETPTLALLAVLFAVFWLLKPPFAARTGAFIGIILCVFYLLTENSYSYYGMETVYAYITFYIKTGLYGLGLLWAAHYFVALDSRVPERLKQPANKWLSDRLNWQEVLSSSAYASLITLSIFALLPVGSQFNLHSLFILNLSLGTAIVFAVLTAILSYRYPDVRRPLLILGILLTITAYFAPSISLGLGLVFMAFYTGKNSFLAAAVAYLGVGTFIYYYNLNLTLLYKSFVLMGTGAALLCFAFAANFLGIKEKA